MTKCLYQRLQAAVDAGAVGQEGSEIPLYYVAEVRLKCEDCKMPFTFAGEFKGPTQKVPDRPFVQDVGAPVTKLCLPIIPAPQAKRWAAGPKLH